MYTRFFRVICPSIYMSLSDIHMLSPSQCQCLVTIPSAKHNRDAATSHQMMQRYRTLRLLHYLPQCRHFKLCVYLLQPLPHHVDCVAVAQWLSASNIFRLLCQSISEWRRFESLLFLSVGIWICKNSTIKA